jgi:hypothetical protein
MNIMAHDLRAQVFFSQSLLRPENNAEGSSKNFQIQSQAQLVAAVDQLTAWPSKTKRRPI